jgi:hypothetical protein
VRATISEELLDMIDESIYLQLELHIIDKKITKAEADNNEGFANHLRKIHSNIIKQHKEINDHLRQNGIKIHEVEVLDDMFVSIITIRRLTVDLKKVIINIGRQL